MAANITIDDALVREAMTVTGIESKEKVVEKCLRLIVEQKRQKIEALREALIEGEQSGVSDRTITQIAEEEEKKHRIKADASV